MNEVWKYLASHIDAWPYLACLGTAIACLLSVCAEGRRAKRKFDHLSGPVPTMSEPEALKEYNQKLNELSSHADSAGTAVGFWVLLCILFLVYLLRFEWNFYLLVVEAVVLLVPSFVLWNLYPGRYERRCEQALENRPELESLRYLRKLPTPRKNGGKANGNDGAQTDAELQDGDGENGENSQPREQKLCWATLDDFVHSFEVGGNESTPLPTPLEPQAAKALSDAQWRSCNHETPQEGELVLLIWRDGTSQKIKTVVTVIKSVEEAPAQSLLTTPGRYMIKAAGEMFCGGRVAHYCDAPTDKIERGWMATADRAHILLASLTWLDDNQREFCYQLINPGKACPPVTAQVSGE